jgi:hypothetical protein
VIVQYHPFPREDVVARAKPGRHVRHGLLCISFESVGSGREIRGEKFGNRHKEYDFPRILRDGKDYTFEMFHALLRPSFSARRSTNALFFQYPDVRFDPRVLVVVRAGDHADVRLSWNLIGWEFK